MCFGATEPRCRGAVDRVARVCRHARRDQYARPAAPGVREGAVLTQRVPSPRADLRAQMVDATTDRHPRHAACSSATPAASGAACSCCSLRCSAADPVCCCQPFDPAAVLPTPSNSIAAPPRSPLPAMMQFRSEEQAKKPRRDAVRCASSLRGWRQRAGGAAERTRQLMGVSQMAEGLAQTETGPTICNPPRRAQAGLTRHSQPRCRSSYRRCGDAAGRPGRRTRLRTARAKSGRLLRSTGAIRRQPQRLYA